MKFNDIKLLKDKYIDLWWDSSAGFPAFDEEYDDRRQAGTEARMESFINYIVAEVRKFTAGPVLKGSGWGSGIRTQIYDTGVEALGFAPGGMELLLSKSFVNATSDFLEAAHKFDPSVKLDDTMQALRNVWIMNCLQLMLEREVEYTPPLFAYSMLYPYTDNYLDAPRISPDKKAQTGIKLRLRLEGKPVEASNAYEGKLFKLVEMIEGYYSRETEPEVFESLLWIHDAQQDSILQQKSVVSPYENNILNLSFRKGGSSVLADAYLVKGALTPEEARFMFGFGIVLQLGDDLQDAMTDRRNGHMTVFSQTAGRWPLDSITNKLFNFAYRILDGARSGTPAMGELSAIMKRSCTLLLLEAIANNDSLFSKGYLRSIEAYSPMSLKYFRHMSGRVRREYGSLKLRNAGRPVEVYIAKALANTF